MDRARPQRLPLPLRSPRAHTACLALLAGCCWPTIAAAQTAANAAQPTPNGDTRGEADAPADPTEVTVLGSRLQKASGSVHSIGKKQLERFELDDPHSILLSVPGVYVRTEDGYGLRPNIGIRGAISDRSKKLTLTEDGVLFGPAPYSAPAAYYFPLMTRMQDVRVIKGPGAILYGPQTVGGAIDLVTESVPSRTSAYVDLGYGSYNYQKLDARVGTSDERFGVLVAGTHIGSGGFKQIDGGGKTGFYRNEVMVKAHYHLNPQARDRHTLSLKLGYSDEDSHETYLGLSDEDFRRTPYRRYAASANDRMLWHRTSVVISHRAEFGRHLVLETSAYRHDMSRSWNKINTFSGAPIAGVLADPTTPRNAVYYGGLTGQSDSGGGLDTLLIGPNQRSYVSQGVQTVARVQARTGPVAHRLEYGVRGHYDAIERMHTQSGFLMQSARLVADGRAVQTTADNTGWTAALALHAADAMTWKRTVLTPGLRAEVIRSGLDDRLAGTHQQGSYTALLPGAGLFQGLTDDLGVLAGVYRGFSPTAPGQSRTSKPESSVNYEAGVRYAKRKVRAEVIGFYNAYSNLTDVCTFSNGCVNQNLDRQFDAGKARVYGVEAFAEGELRLHRDWSLPARASYTFTQSKLLNEFNSQDPLLGDVKVGDHLPYMPLHQFAVSAGVEGRRVGFHLSGTYVGSMREVASQGEIADSLKTDAYFLLGASASLRVLPWLKVYGTGQNLTNQAYIASRRPYGARPGAPLMVNVGVKAEF